MKYETSVVYLEQVPKLVVDTGFDMATFLSFAITVFIFVIGTALTIWNANKNGREQREIFNETIAAQEKTLERTLESQAKIARSGAVKISRQAWIDELRQCCSSYVALLVIINGHSLHRDAHESFGHELAKQNHADAAAELVVGWTSKLVELRSKIYELRYRIELLSNPKEELFQLLLVHVRTGVSICESAPTEELLKECEAIKDVAQQILKTEWDKTKNML